MDHLLILLTFQGKLDNVEAKMEKVQKELSKTDEMILNGEKKLSAIEEFLSKENDKEKQEVKDISKFRYSLFIEKNRYNVFDLICILANFLFRMI